MAGDRGRLQAHSSALSLNVIPDINTNQEQAYIAVRHDGFVDGACFSESGDAQSWCHDMAMAGFVVMKRDRDEAKRILFTHIPPPRSVLACGVPAIGLYQGKPIPPWIETGDGWRGEFAGVCGQVADISTLPVDCRIIGPGLMYRSFESITDNQLNKFKNVG